MGAYIGDVILSLKAANGDRNKMVQIIKENRSKPLATIFMAAFGPPAPVFQPNEIPAYNTNTDPVGLTFTTLAKVTRKLGYFYTSGEQMAKPSLERLFINICEGLHANEADIFAKVVTKRLYVKGLDAEIINKGFGEKFLDERTFQMLNETLLSFEEWRERLETEGETLPPDVIEQHKLYEAYVAEFA